jgi:hypothetical protein
MNSPDTYDPPESIAAPPTITVTRDTDTLYRNLAPGEVVTVRNSSGRSVDLRLVERDKLKAEAERLKAEVRKAKAEARHLATGAIICSPYGGLDWQIGMSRGRQVGSGEDAIEACVASVRRAVGLEPQKPNP